MSFVVVGVDGSETAHRALIAAIEQAKVTESAVRVVSVVVLPAVSGYEFGPLDLQGMKDAAAQTINAAVDRATDEYGDDLPVEISGEVRVGHIGTELVRAVEADEGAAMIVAGSRGFGGLKSVLLGSTTTYLAHHLSCPLLIIPADKDKD